MLYKIMDQNTHGAQAPGVAVDPQILEVLAHRLLDFVRLSDILCTQAALSYQPQAKTEIGRRP